MLHFPSCHISYLVVAVDVVFQSVEQGLEKAMARLGLGRPSRPSQTVRAVLRELLDMQGAFLEGEREGAFEGVVGTIVTMVGECVSSS